MINPATVDTVIEAAQIEEVIGEFVTLKKRGVNYTGLCPFHNEKTPSFSVSPSKGIFKCFGCGQSGNSVKFLMDHENYTFPEAIRYLADKYNIVIEEEVSREISFAEKDTRESLLIINSFAQKYFDKQLFETEEGRSIGLSYFKERGFREEIIRKFQLGYAANEYDSLTKAILEAGYKPELVKELGLIKEKEGRKYDFFRGRVQFTIHNLSGKPVAFAGRTLSKDKKQPKYINSPETPVYNKSKILYGLWLAKNAIRQQNECLLVEGYTDVISLHQGGLENVVASSGTALTPDQVRLIKRFSPNITILYDGDEAGIKAAGRGLEIILEEGMNVKIAVLPAGEDPDSFIRSVGSSDFTAYIKENATDFIFFKTSSLLKEAAGNPVKISETIKEIVTTIARIPDPIKRSLYIRECSQLLKVQEQLLINETNKLIRKHLHKNTTATQTEAEDLQKQFRQPEDHRQMVSQKNDIQEKDMIRILLQHGHKMYEKESTVAELVVSELEEITMENQVYNKILTIYKEKIMEQTIPGNSFFTGHADREVSTSAIGLLADKYEVSENWEKKFEIFTPHPDINFMKDVQSALLRFKLKIIHKYLKLNSEEIKSASGEEELNKIIKEKMELTKIKIDLSGELNTVIYGGNG